jgi:hypothetical protein
MKRRDPAWRAMFHRLDAKRRADRIAEAVRWRGLSDEAKWAEMAAAAGRWRRGLSGKYAEQAQALAQDMTS